AVWLRWLEEPPYGTFTMVLSLLAIYMAWVLLMNQNRQAAKDRQRDDLEAAEVDEMVKLNQQQVEHDQWTRRDMERQDHDLVAIGRALKAELGRRYDDALQPPTVREGRPARGTAAGHDRGRAGAAGPGPAVRPGRGGDDPGQPRARRLEHRGNRGQHGAAVESGHRRADSRAQ